MNILRQAIKRAMGAVLPTGRMLLRGDVRCLPSCSGCESGATPISLTFDDGPHPDWTPPVLDALDEAGWIGTFFVVGRDADARPDLVKEIVARGHEIGNHSYFHDEPDQTGARQLVDGVLRTKELLAELTGHNVTLMRPPKGRLNLWKTRSLWRIGQTVVLWNIDPKDFELSSVDAAAAWADEYTPSAGDIVLLHDRLPHAAEIVRTLARTHDDRLRSVPVSAWLEDWPSPTRKANLQSAGERSAS